MRKLINYLTIMIISSSISNIGCAKSNEQSMKKTSSQMEQTKNTNEVQPVAEISKQENLRMAMRKLWEDHITYTRNFIISDLGNLKDVDAVSERLMKNQEEIGDAIKPYYGGEAGDKLTNLLKDHIQIAVEVVESAKKNNKEALGKSQKKWKENANDIALFLSSANPNWSKETLEKMLSKHLDLTTGEVSARLKGDWKKDLESYDKGHAHMLIFSDTLVDGIARQFPEKFK